MRWMSLRWYKVKSIVKEWLDTPDIVDGDPEVRLRFLNTILTVITIILFGMILLFVALRIGFAADKGFGLSFASSGVMLAVTFGLRWLARRGKIVVVSYALVAMLWLGATISAYAFEGIADGSVVAYFFVLAMAALLLGRRAILQVAALSAAGGVFLFVHDLLVRPDIKVSYYIFRLVVLVLVLAVTALILSMTIRVLNDSIERAGSELLDRKRAEEAESRQRQLAESLVRTAMLLTSTLNLEVVLDQMLAELGHAIPYRAGSIIAIEEHGPTILRSVGYDQPLALDDIAGSFALRQYQQAQDGEPIIISDAANLSGWNVEHWGRSCAGTPILIDERLHSFLTVIADEPSVFGQEHIPYLLAFGNLAATAIKNARSYQRLELTSTELARAVEKRTHELLEVSQRVEAIFDSVGEGLMVVDVDGVVERVNPALVRQTGYSALDLVGSNYRQLMDRIQASRAVLDDLQAATDNNLPWQGEIVVIRADGSTYDAAVTVSPLLDDHRQGKEIATVVSLRDVSHIKEVTRLKTQFLATAAHELRTPLTSIRGFSEILLNRDLSVERQKSYLEIINAQSVLLSGILNDLLDISRLESGRGMPLQFTAVNPVRVIKQVLKALKGTFPRHNFRLDGMRACPPVRADEMRLEQVFLNLLSNAAKYSPEGGDIVLSAQASGKQVAIRVTDNGIGMTPEQQTRLFETFYRASEVVEMNIGGTGLGLAICKYIMELMDGRIEVESEHGVGSTFTAWLPLAESEEQLGPRP